jgi:tetratricopeptide (TPR) repeat protein
LSGLPEEAEQIVRERPGGDGSEDEGAARDLSEARKEFEARRQLIAALLRTGEPPQAGSPGEGKKPAATALQEPSWAALGLLLRELTFVQVYRATGYQRYHASASFDAWAATVVPLVQDHPAQPVLDTFSLDINKVRAATMKMVRIDRVGNEFSPRHFGGLFLPAMQNRLQQAGLVGETINRDDLARDYVACVRSAVASNVDPGKPLLDTLLVISPYSPFARAVLIQYHWNDIQPRASQWETESTNQPALLIALAEHYAGLRRWDDAQRCLKAAIQVVPCDLSLYQRSAAIYEEQGQPDRWLATLEEYLNQRTFDSGHYRVQDDIAEHFMRQKRWNKALRYAEGAAQSKSSWGLVCAAECNEALQNWEEAEKNWRMTSEHFVGSFMQWYGFCRRTGKGNLSQSQALARDFVDKLNSGVYIPNACGLDWWDMVLFHLLEAQPAKALVEIEKIVARQANADDVLWMALIADQAEDAAKRDAALGRVSQLSRSDSRGAAALAEASAKDLAEGAKGQLDLDALEKVEVSLTAPERFSFDYCLAQYLYLRGRSEEARRYALQCLGCPLIGARYRTLAGAMLVEQGGTPADYQALLRPRADDQSAGE